MEEDSAYQPYQGWERRQQQRHRQGGVNLIVHVTATPHWCRSSDWD